MRGTRRTASRCSCAPLHANHGSIMMMKTDSRELKAEAESLIRDLSLLEVLRLHGDARVVGSVALDLVVKPDIDVHLLTNSDDLIGVVGSVVQSLLAQGTVKHVRISDYRDRGGLKVGIDAYPGVLACWSIDIWVTNRPETTGFALVDRLCHQLTGEQRHAILDIKRAFHAEGALQDGMSTRIYAAVVDHGVRSAAEFKSQMKEGSNKAFEATRASHAPQG
jgi:hypothetical protein